MIIILSYLILSYHIQFNPYHPTRTVTAGYAAETDSEWKNSYIIYAGNDKTPGKIIRKKIKKRVESIVLRCYTTVVRKEREQNPGTGTRNLKISP
jgi:hypothetical protein